MLANNRNERADDWQAPSSRRSQVLLTDLYTCVVVPEADLANANVDVNRLKVHHQREAGSQELTGKLNGAAAG